MKSRHAKPVLKALGFLCVLCGSVVHCFSLDREAFTFTNYDLNLQIDPAQHRLAVRGRVKLHNDSPTPQKIAVLQISSSLDWRAIKTGDKPLQFVTQPFTSDIDHTGALSEALVTLPQEVAPKATVDLDIAYEGVIVRDATRLTRIGTPEDQAASSDWDEIGENFTAVRGAGYVAWYPIATNVANLSEGNNLFEVLGRWKARTNESQMTVLIESTTDGTILFSGYPELLTIARDEPIVSMGAFAMVPFGVDVPTFALAEYKKLDVNGTSSIEYLPGKDAAARTYAEVLGSLDPLGIHVSKGLQVVQLADPDVASFASQGMLLMPFRPSATSDDRMKLVYALAREQASSHEAWISEGLAHFAQVLDIERKQGRKAALEYLEAHGSILNELEKPANQNAKATDDRSLVSTTDEIYRQSKAMYVWSMLRDMVGDISLNLALFSYRAGNDKSPAYMQELLTKHTERDLQWFFDDWVYHDRGLPDFKVESVFPLKTAAESYMVTVTVSNAGSAGAEVPVTVKFAGGEVTKRLEVRGKSKATTRIEIPKPPVEVTVNDGSVPESDVTNNTFKLDATPKP